MKRFFIVSVLFFLTLNAFPQNSDYKIIHDIHYYPESLTSGDEYIAERCVLDVYYPEKLKDCPVLVWFHGGGLKGGNKFIPERLKGQGIVVVAVNYRFYPKNKSSEVY